MMKGAVNQANAEIAMETAFEPSDQGNLLLEIGEANEDTEAQPFLDQESGEGELVEEKQHVKGTEKSKAKGGTKDDKAVKKDKKDKTKDEKGKDKKEKGKSKDEKGNNNDAAAD